MVCVRSLFENDLTILKSQRLLISDKLSSFFFRH